MLNQPVYVGFTIPELSKWLIYDFYYSFIKKHFDTKLLFTDTGSVTCLILVTIQRIQSFLMRLIKKLLVK